MTVYRIVRTRRNGRPLTCAVTVHNRIEAPNPASALATYRATVANPYPVDEIEAMEAA